MDISMMLACSEPKLATLIVLISWFNTWSYCTGITCQEYVVRRVHDSLMNMFLIFPPTEPSFSLSVWWIGHGKLRLSLLVFPKFCAFLYCPFNVTMSIAGIGIVLAMSHFSLDLFTSCPLFMYHQLTFSVDVTSTLTTWRLCLILHLFISSPIAGKSY